MLPPSASPAVHPSAARSRRHRTARVSLRLVDAGLLKCRPPCRPSGFNVGAVPKSAACRSSFGAESPATRPRVCGFEGAALTPDAQRMDYKLCLLVHKSSHGQALEYISNMLKAAAAFWHFQHFGIFRRCSQSLGHYPLTSRQLLAQRTPSNVF